MGNVELQDGELGRIVVKVNSRARNTILRVRRDAIYITAPFGVSGPEVRTIVDKYRLKLSEAREKARKKPIDLDYRIEAGYFKLSLARGGQGKFLVHSGLGDMRIVCPKEADFTNEGLQEWLRKVILEALRKNAKIILPPRLRQLSNQFNLPYESVKIGASKGRWGSCSARKLINLSCYLMLLPRHLVDYVLLHELSHTKEMNHGERFWALLDSITGGKARALSNELKKHSTEF